MSARPSHPGRRTSLRHTTKTLVNIDHSSIHWIAFLWNHPHFRRLQRCCFKAKRKFIFTAVLHSITGPSSTSACAFAQTTGPAAQDSTKLGSDLKSYMLKRAHQECPTAVWPMTP